MELFANLKRPQGSKEDDLSKDLAAVMKDLSSFQQFLNSVGPVGHEPSVDLGISGWTPELQKSLKKHMGLQNHLWGPRDGHKTL